MHTKLILFGVTGDLAKKKLLASLSSLVSSGQDIEIIGITRKKGIEAEDLLASSLGETSALASRLSIYSMDIADSSVYAGLKASIPKADQTLIYLSLPPAAAASVSVFLGQAGINTSDIKLLFEKPFGWDLESAKGLIDQTAEYFSDEQIYRIDHYLAKDIATKIIDRHFKNEQSDRSWNSQNVDSIDVLMSETDRVDQRDSYDQIGQLRDTIQNHVLQLLALSLLEVKPAHNLSDLADLRLNTLNSIAPANPDLARRAAYDGYQKDVQNPGSLTETFVKVELQSNLDNWRGVRLNLIAGKALDEKQLSVQVNFKDGSKELFIEHNQTDAYERVLDLAIRGEKSLFISGQEVLRSWEILAPIQYYWAMSDQPLPTYAPGSSPSDILA